MDHPISENPVIGFVGSSLTIFSGTLCSIIPNVETGVRIAAGLAALITAAFTCTHYWYKIRESRETLKKFKN